LQGEETDSLLKDDVAMLCESLWQQFDRFVIQYTLGDTRPLAYLSIPLAGDPDLQQLRESAGFLADRGVPISSQNVAEMLGFSVAAADEPTLAAVSPQPAPAPGLSAFNAAPARPPREKQFIAASIKSALAGIASDFKPLAGPLRTLQEAVASNDPERIRSAAASVQQELQARAGEILTAPSELADRLQSIIGPALLSGIGTKQS